MKRRRKCVAYLQDTMIETAATTGAGFVAATALGVGDSVGRALDFDFSITEL